MRTLGMAVLAVATLIAGAAPALADRGRSSPSPRPPSYGSQPEQPRVHDQRNREPARQDAGRPQAQAHDRVGGPRLDQRPDPNYQNPYRPLYSPDAMNPGEQHPYFQTPKAGFGYPTGNTGVYQGNGNYVNPR
jgi:hypothetical protein